MPLLAPRFIARASFSSLDDVMTTCTPIACASCSPKVERTAASAGLDLKAHPHMLRHACGYALANNGHDTRAILAWLGHRSITSTAIYTALAPNRFKDFWRD